MTDLRTELADIVAALVEPYVTSERYDIGPIHRVHRVRHDSLIDQLAGAIEPPGDGAAGHAIPASRPAARIDAIDRLLAIEAGAAMALRPHERLSDDVRVNLRKLVGVVWDGDELAALVKDARRWLAWARTVTGWDTPPFRPHVRCPACDWRDSLRVRLVAQTACCVECGAAWDSATIGVLAEYIRMAGDVTPHSEVNAARAAAGGSYDDCPKTTSCRYRDSCVAAGRGHAAARDMVGEPPDIAM